MHDEVTTDEHSVAAQSADGDVATGEAGDDPVDGTSTTGPTEEESAAALAARAEADPRSRVELLAAVETAETQRDEYLDDLRRAHADFDNYRKRVARDSGVQRETGRADVVGALLDVLDDLDRVVAAAGGVDADTAGTEAAAVASGVRVVADKARQALGTFGVERVDTPGVPFDPTVHDAVQQVDDEDVETPTVHEILRPGYRITERVLRPAMVVVAQ